LTGVSEVLIASIMRASECLRPDDGGSKHLIYQTTRRNVPEDSHLHTRRENLKSHKLRIFGNRMLRRIFGPGGWRKVHNEELCNLYSSPDIINVIK
jgi:hypothetical protein